MKTSVRISLASFAFLGIVLFAGCKGRTNASTKLLTRAAWKYEKKGFRSDKEGYIDMLNSRASDCEKDDLTIFNPDGSGVFKSGTVKCDPSDPPALPFTWQLENHDSTIYFEGQHFHIKTLSDSKLVIFKDEELGRDDYRFIIAFRH
jgi:hypothetical protein